MESLPFDVQMVLLRALHSICNTSFIVLSHANNLYHKYTAIYATKYHIGNPISRHVSSSRIASKGYLNILKWAKSNEYPLNYYMYHRAAINNHIEILEWAKQNGYNWNEYIKKKTDDRPTSLKLPTDTILFSFTCERVAFKGHYDVLKWFISNSTQHMLKKLQNNYRICAGIAYKGNIEILKWARKQGFKWNHITCTWTTYNGQIETLKWLKLNGCHSYMQYVCQVAAMTGRLEVLQWARLNGCPWSFTVCGIAAKMGHLHILKWARLNGCPWNSDTCAFAVIHDNLEILKWARQHGCPWDSGTEELAKLKWPNDF
jgi:hypothetical protein